MKHLLILSVLLITLLVSAQAGNDYLWGEIGSRDTLISKVIVHKPFVVGLVVTKKYVFKQDVSSNQNEIKGFLYNIL